MDIDTDCRLPVLELNAHTGEVGETERRLFGFTRGDLVVAPPAHQSADGATGVIGVAHAPDLRSLALVERLLGRFAGMAGRVQPAGADADPLRLVGVDDTVIAALRPGVTRLRGGRLGHREPGSSGSWTTGGVRA